MNDTTKTPSVQPDAATLHLAMSLCDVRQDMSLMLQRLENLQSDGRLLAERVENLQSDVDRLAIGLANVIVQLSCSGLMDGGSGDPYIDRCSFCGGDDPDCQNHGQNSHEDKTHEGQS